jgi:predicted amidophosphoribosyltransferase
VSWLAGAFADLADLVLPADCAGCAAPGRRLRHGVCRSCADELWTLSPAPARPSPEPAGLPHTVALGGYEGVLREALLAYKERGRHGLAAPLGALLAEAVAAAAGPDRPLLLVPVPSSPAAARDRGGDHLARLARHTGRRLRGAGRRATVARPLCALPRADSAGLSSAERAAAVAGGFRVRRSAATRLRRAAAGARVVVLDDIVTTGSTLAAVSGVLASAGAPVWAAAVLAATRRRHPPGGLSGQFRVARDPSGQ